jgi:hypothetical protein
MADQVFKGINAGDLPVETAEVYLAINLETAKATGWIYQTRSCERPTSSFVRIVAWRPGFQEGKGHAP